MGNIPYITNDARFVSTDRWLRYQLYSFVGVPIINEERLLAMLALGGSRPSVFQPVEQSLLDSFIAPAAIIAAELSETDPGRQVWWEIAPKITAQGDSRVLRIVLENLLNRIRADTRTRYTPGVVLTSSDDQRDIVESYRLGVHSYVRKSVDFNQFQEVVCQLHLYWLLSNTPPPGDLS